MLLCIVLALILQNGSYSTSYRHWLDTTAGIVFGDFILMKPLLLWINDGLITIFFFSIGLQLKIEFVEGHLSDPRNILLPSIAAIAGICTPALIFILFNYHDEFAMRGWAIPTSTDTAFAVALIMLLGKRVPNSLKILLLSISVFDDMGAMAVVAIFYNSGLDVYALIPAAVSIVGLMILNFFGVGRKSLYIALGAIIWFSILKSGVHATIAGIITAFSMPMRDRSGAPVVQEVSDNIGLWVSFAILPLFTLANAGVDLGNINISTMFSNVSLGIILALIIGKPLGIFTVIYLASRYKLVQLPSDVNTKQLYGMSLLTGIGFSMAMFYDSLAYEGSSIYGYADSLAILIGATFSGIHGYCYLRFFACKTALIEYRPWLPAPTGYHGTARTANLYSLENPIQGPSSVAPTAAAVAEANKRSAAAAEAAQKAIEAAEAASKVAELLKKASDKEQDEQNLAEVQLAAAQAAKAAATVAVTATKIDTSEDNAQKTQSAEAVLKTVSEVAQEAEETVERAIDEDKAVENQATLADEDKQNNDNKVANNETEELKSKSTTKVSAADESLDSESDKSEVKNQDTVKASQEAHTVIAVDSEGLAKVEKTAVKSTDESAAVDDSPLNADDYASTTVSAKSASDESKTQEDKIASNQSSKSSDDDVSEQSDENESSASSKAEGDVQESVESEAKTVKKIKAKTKYELSVEEVDHSSEKIAEHKEVAQGTAKAVAAYLSNIVGKAKVEVSENIERSDEEKAALRAAAAARVAAIKAAEIEAQALAEAAVAEAKAKAALQAAEAKAKAAAQESKSKADTTTESDSKAVVDEQETLLQESTVDVAELSKIASESKETVKENAASDELNAADFAPQANDSADTKAKAQEGDADKSSLEARDKDESKEAVPGEACASKSADSSDDEDLKAAADAQAAQEEVAKAAAEAEAAKAKALEAKQAVEKAAHEARVAAEIAAAKKAEGKQKAKAQNALEAQKKAEEEGGHKEESDTLGEVTAKAASAVSTVASVVAAPAVKAVKIVSATASVTASVTAAAAKAAVKVVEHKDKAEDERHDDKNDTTKEVADTLVKEIISAKDPRFSESNESSKDGSHDDSNATETKADAKAKVEAKVATATAAADKDSAVSDSAAVKPTTQDTTQKAAIKEQTQAKTVDAKESKSFAEENSYSEKADDLTKAHDETVKSVLEAHDAPEFAVANNNELNASELSQKISTLDEQQAKVTLQAASDDDDLTVESVLAVNSSSSDVAANSNAQAVNSNMPTADDNAASDASDDLNAEDYQDKKPSDVEDKDEQKEDSSAVKSVVGKLAGIIRKGKD